MSRIDNIIAKSERKKKNIQLQWQDFQGTLLHQNMNQMYLLKSERKNMYNLVGKSKDRTQKEIEAIKIIVTYIDW